MTTVRLAFLSRKFKDNANPSFCAVVKLTEPSKVRGNPNKASDIYVKHPVCSDSPALTAVICSALLFTWCHSLIGRIYNIH